MGGIEDEDMSQTNEFRTVDAAESLRLAGDYERDGVIRVPGLLTAAGIEQVRAELVAYHRDVRPTLPAGDCVVEADGQTVRNYWRMEQHGPYFRELAGRAAVRALVAQLVHGEPVLAAVELFNKPAKVGSAVPPHQDNAYFCQSPPDMLTVWIALDPATEANGPVTYIRGSHRQLLPHKPSGVAGNSMGLAQPPRPAPGEAYVGLLERGDALIHHSQVIHWSAPNKSDQSRCGMLLVYRGAHTQTDPSLRADYDRARG